MTAPDKSSDTHDSLPNQSVWRDLIDLWNGIGETSSKRQFLLFIASVVIVIAANTCGQIQLNIWQGDFYDAISKRDIPAFVQQLEIFGLIVSGLLVLIIAQTWINERIKIVIRGMITLHLLAEWLVPKRAYLLQHVPEIGHHPDQRVHEDSRHFAELAADLVVGLIQSTLLIVSFVGVLWILSDNMVLAFGTTNINIPGYMVWFALAYSLAGSFLTYWIGRPLIHLNADRYTQEAALRFSLVSIDDSAQSIALNKSENSKYVEAENQFEKVQLCSRKLSNTLAQLTFVTSAYGWGTFVAPVIAAMPAYFSGSLSLGGLMMVVGAFGQVQQALRWFVDNFPRIADCRATLTRVCVLRRTLSGLNNHKERPHITITESDSPQISLTHLELDLPDGDASISINPLTIKPAERVLLVGKPGSGKSHIFLAIAGLWTLGKGKIELPKNAKILFLAEHPYIPNGTLYEAISPQPGFTVSKTRIMGLMDELDISHLKKFLDRDGRWERDLHLDEQQAVAFIRVMLQNPDWVIIDEALSALDEYRRRAVLALLLKELPNTGFIGTGRPNQQDGFWQREVAVDRNLPNADDEVITRPRRTMPEFVNWVTSKFIDRPPTQLKLGLGVKTQSEPTPIDR